jgi:hypothetical protein
VIILTWVRGTFHSSRLKGTQSSVANESRLIVMAILCSQELLNFTIEHFPLLRSKTRAPRTWQAFLLGLDFALEYPLVFTFLPSVPPAQAPSRVIWSSSPKPVALIFQIVVLLLVENLCSILLPAFGPSQEKEFAAAIALSAEFLAPRITLMVGIPLLESILLGRVVVGQLYFGGIVGWLVFRHFFVKSRL